MSAGRRYIVKTLGCKANLFDSQLLEAELGRRGWQPAEGEAVDLCIVNTCTVTDEADRQSRRMARRLSRAYPGARVVVTGCGAEVDPHRLEQVQGVHYIVGNRDKPRLVDLLETVAAQQVPAAPTVLGVAEGYAEMRARHPMDREWPLPEALFESPAGLSERDGAARTRAFLKIQEGCDAFCTFCIIPFARGPSRSLRPREIVAQVRALTDQGVREVVLTGTNLGDYGRDWGGAPALDELVARLLEATPLQRLRISSLDPTEISPALLELAAREPRLCPHFHVSLQSPHDRVLKAMKRGYRHAEVEACLRAVAALPAPAGGPFVGMDVIAGFPGETEAEFEWTVQALEALPWTRLHVFPYSERAGTAATRIAPPVPPAERKRRARRLMDQSLARLTATYREVLAGGAPLDDVLVEGPVRGPDGTPWMAGHTRNYLRCAVPAGAAAPNTVIRFAPRELAVDAQAGDVLLLGGRAD